MTERDDLIRRHCETEGRTMPEYISREAALDAQNKSMNLAECRKRLERLPAADVVVVVRCGECRYHYKTYSGWFCSHGVFVNDAVPLDDFYCGYGKRKDGG